MAMSVGGGDSDEDAEISEMNVTPFIDVMLVLLIVFMVAAPLSTVDTPVDLPSSNAPPQDRPQDPLWLTLTVEGQLVFNDTPLTPATLGGNLDAASGGDKDAPVFLRADQSIAYGQLMQVLNDLRAAGYLKVSLVGLEGAPP